MGATILSWISENGLIVCVIVGIIGIAFNFIQYAMGKGSFTKILITAVILIVVIGLIVAVTNYSSFQGTMQNVATSALSGVGTELGSAVGSGS